MNQKISFKEWFANFYKGIWQALCWMGRIFNPKHKTPFWRVVCSVIAVCIIVLTTMVGWACYRYNHNIDKQYNNRRLISANMCFVKPYLSNRPGWIQNISTMETITSGIDWIAISADEDSLIVFGNQEKRGYINRYSGEIAIPAQFRKAWIFSSGVAAVADGDSVYFIDHSGKALNKNKFKYNPKTHGYVYHGDYCAVAVDNGMMGLIDKSGNWAVEPEYDWISSEVHDFWRMRKGDSETGMWYAFNDKAQKVTDIGYPAIEISEDYGIMATLPNHMLVSYGFDGQKSAAFILNDFETMHYDTESYDANGEKIYAPTTLKRYRMPGGYEGLCTADGDIVTEPIYWEVQPLTKNTYFCKYKSKYQNSGVGVIINSKGDIIQHKNI